MVQFSLQWEEYKKNLCDGLSSLQQNGEMVDVTLAADGHLVRVHRLVLSLASPYLKELLTSASDCKHPVVFLNKVSFVSLSSILEYIYTGQVVLSEEQLPDLLEAAKALRIKGLEAVGGDDNMMDAPNEIPISRPKIQLLNDQYRSDPVMLKPLEGCKIGKYHSGASGMKTTAPEAVTITSKTTTSLYNTFAEEHLSDSEIATDTGLDDTAHDQDTELDTDKDCSVAKNLKTAGVRKRKYTRIDTIPNITSAVRRSQEEQPSVQYTVSNSGTLQMIVNRYIYYVRYVSKKGNGVKNWRCVNYIKFKCPAMFLTKNDIIIKRSGVHNHEFHDKRILKKVQANLVYATPNSAKIISKQKMVKSKSGNESEKMDE